MFQEKKLILNPDEYMDLAIKNVLMFDAKIVEQPVIDLAKVKELKIYLVNEAENVAVGCGFINREKNKLNIEDLTPEEKDLFEACKKYYKSKENIFGANIERLATKMLAEAVIGRYDARIQHFTTQIEEKISNGHLSETDRNILLCNERFKLILDSIETQKSRKIDFDA
jgi:hypothetical protein